MNATPRPLHLEAKGIAVLPANNSQRDPQTEVR